jgi:hypothetical protein
LAPASGFNLVQRFFLRLGPGPHTQFQAADFAWKILTNLPSCQVRQNGEEAHHFGDFCFYSLFFNKL